MSNRLTNIIATGLLIFVFVIAVFSMLDDSATMDELSHIPAGYSYLSQKDFRINPEHPPLIKDLAALPLLFLDLNFPKDHPSWAREVNSQWWFGAEFLYRSGNNPDQIIFWARIPMIFVLVFLGYFLFKWAKELGGNGVALFVLILFSFSPTFLAHGKLVTTDVAAALGVVITTYFWLIFLKKPSKQNIIWAGFAFGIAMLLKFSLILLVPFFLVITLIFTLTFGWLKTDQFKGRILLIFKYLALIFLIGVIGIMLIWPIYQFHVLNYPPERQLSDTKTILESAPFTPLKKLCIWMSDKPMLRPLAHYLLGLLMAVQRTIFGNTVYFLGMISAAGWWFYFPIVYILKEPLAFHIFTLIALLFWASRLKKPFWIETKTRIKSWILHHFSEFSMLVFLAIYWITSISGKLNIGVRHLLPVYPFTYILVALGINNLISGIKKPLFKKVTISFVLLLISWYVISSLLSFPYYLSYFNEIAGGIENGYQYVVDSNYDWGQDLKRLAKFIEENKIEKIKVDYFGGGDVQYYLGEKWERFDPLSGPQKGWIAISATLLQGGKGNPVPSFDQPTGYYRWLDQYQPIARAGKSIFIYYIE